MLKGKTNQKKLSEELVQASKPDPDMAEILKLSVLI